MSDFRKAFEMQVSKTCGAIEESIVKSYEDQSHVIEEKLQEIFAAIERISKHHIFTSDLLITMS